MVLTLASLREIFSALVAAQPFHGFLFKIIGVWSVLGIGSGTALKLTFRSETLGR
jgi:hypothetical protein